MIRTTRKLFTLSACLLLCIILAAIIPVPLVAIGPGPTFDTLSEINGQPIVAIEGASTHPTTGHLNMTTVSQQDGLTLGSALLLWLSRQEQLIPRNLVYPPGKTQEEVVKTNTADFIQSEHNAEYAALAYLQYRPAVTVVEVQPEGASAQELHPGDALDAVNNIPIETMDQFQEVMASTHPGQTITINYRRKNAPPGVKHITLEDNPDLTGNPDQHHGFLGITVIEAPWAPFSITFNLANIGGPSAGLMFSLAVVDKLTDGQLAGSDFIAGTGTITPEGTVGPIGGIIYKMTAAQRAGATSFLVPEENCQEALSAGKKLRLLKVHTLSQAIESLHMLAHGGQPPSC